MRWPEWIELRQWQQISLEILLALEGEAQLLAGHLAISKHKIWFNCIAFRLARGQVHSRQLLKCLSNHSEPIQLYSRAFIAEQSSDRWSRGRWIEDSDRATAPNSPPPKSPLTASPPRHRQASQVSARLNLIAANSLRNHSIQHRISNSRHENAICWANANTCIARRVSHH